MKVSYKLPGSLWKVEADNFSQVPTQHVDLTMFSTLRRVFSSGGVGVFSVEVLPSETKEPDVRLRQSPSAPESAFLSVDIF